MGQAFGTYLQKQQLGRKKVILGHDNRFTSDEINAYFTEGLLSTGCDLLDLGLSLTPLVHYAVIKTKADAGVIITGSHNPKEFNGFRFDLKNANPLYGKELLKLKQIAESGEFVRGEAEVAYDDGEIFETYLADIKSRIHLEKPLRLAIDCGNGTASAFAVRLFKQFPCEIFPLYCNLHGDYPYHQPDPGAKINMQGLKEIILKEKLDLGLGFDTDGDRFGVIDEKGNIYENDKTLIVLARDVLKNHPGSKVLFDVKSSYVLANEIKKMGGQPFITRTGHSFFHVAIMENKDIFLGGEVSGHTYIKDNYYGFDDGLYAGARILEILSKADHPYSQFFADVPKTAHTEELKAPCPDDQKFQIVEEIKQKIREEIINSHKDWQLIEIDGVRIRFSPTEWALIRASNTTPNLSLRFEAESKDKLKEIVGFVKSRLERYPVVDLSSLYKLKM